MGRKKAKHARNEDSPEYYDEHLDGVRLPVNEVADVEPVEALPEEQVGYRGEAGQLSEYEFTNQDSLDQYVRGKHTAFDPTETITDYAWLNHPEDLMEVPVSTATSPSYYEYPGGVQMRDITRWHTSNGGQAMQYVGRATRFDLKSKYQSEEGRIEDLDKAINFLEDEKKRLKGEF